MSPNIAGKADTFWDDARVAELLSMGILDTPPDDRFDTITKMASQVAGTPIALVSLVDTDRQWFKSHHGLEARETPRSMAFCDHAIRQSEPLIVPNAQQDVRFADNPLVTSDPNIRFYAGWPLTLPSGNAVGTLCVIDIVPRILSDQQMEMLRDLSKMALDALLMHQSLLEKEHIASEAQMAAQRLRANRTYDEIIQRGLNEVYLFDGDSLNFIMANEGARANLGYSMTELAYMTPLDIKPSMTREHFEARVQPLRRGVQKTVMFDTVHQRKDGSTYPVEVHLHFHHGDTGQAAPLFAAIVIDRSERAEYEERLRRERDLNKSILNACEEAIATYQPIRNADGQIIDFKLQYCNDAACTMRGAAREEVVGRNLKELVPNLPEDNFRAYVDVVETGTPCQFDNHYIDGIYDDWFRVSAARSSQGTMVLLLSIITEQKQRELELKRSRDALSSFAAAISHDLKTPLNHIAGFTDLMRDQLSASLTDEQNEFMGYVIDGVGHMEKLINAMLAQARLGKIEIERQDVDMGALVDGVLRRYHTRFEDCAGKYSVEVSGNLNGDPILLDQLFSNLVSNTLRYRAPSRSLKLHISSEKTDGFMHYCVTDNGIGIPADQSEKVFDLFHRAVGASETEDSLGLGLTTCRGIAEAHGGSISVDTSYSEGARFHVRLPIGTNLDLA